MGLFERLRVDSEVQRMAEQPRSGRIAFHRYSAVTGTYSIHLVDADGSSEQEVVAGSSPAWSPDGSCLAFTHAAASLDVALVKPDGSDFLILTDAYGHQSMPSWSPDGKEIVYCCRLGANPNDQLYVMDSDGANQTQLVPAVGERAFSPAWSPCGPQVAFVREHGAWYSKIAVVDRSSGEERALVPGSYPAWSPNGSRVAFCRDNTVWLVNADGTEETPILEDATAPAWSPDGRWLAFARGASGEEQLFVSTADGLHVAQLTDGPGDGSPSWCG
jgi:Tol biopolymer transport system component